MKIILYGNPRPLKRARHSLGRTYNSQNAIMTALSYEIRESVPLLQRKIEGPVELNIKFFMQIPQSYSKKKRESLINTYHFKKPDIDNLEKMLLDCIVRSDSIIKDDSQVSKMTSLKVYSDQPRTEVIIRSLDEDRGKRGKGSL